jgi:hypothetical protein
MIIPDLKISNFVLDTSTNTATGNLSLTSAQLASLSTSFDYSSIKTALARIGMAVTYRQVASDNYETGVAGWAIMANGDVEFNEGIFRGSLIAGSLHIPDLTSSSSFHVDTSGNAWWGCNVANFVADHNNAVAYILNTGVAKLTKVTISGGSDVSFISDTLDTSAKNILGAFTFGISGAIQIGSYSYGVTGDIKISPNGIVGRNKDGVNTFTIDATTGDATFGGTLVAASGTFGNITAGTLTGTTIQTASTGARIVLSPVSSVGDMLLYDDSTGGGGVVTGDSAQIEFLRTDDNTKGFISRMRAGKDNDADCVYENYPKNVNPTRFNYHFIGRKGTLSDANLNTFNVAISHETGKTKATGNGTLFIELWRDNSIRYTQAPLYVTDSRILYNDDSKSGSVILISGSGANGFAGIGYNYTSGYAAYNGATAYVVNDIVSYNSQIYICIQNSTGNLPTDNNYWSMTYVGTSTLLYATNDTSINLGGHLLPDADSTYDIGTDALRIRTGYFDNIDVANGVGGGTYVAGEDLDQGDCVWMAKGDEKWSIYQNSKSTYTDYVGDAIKVQKVKTNHCTRLYSVWLQNYFTGVSGTYDIVVYDMDPVTGRPRTLLGSITGLTPTTASAWSEFVFASEITIPQNSYIFIGTDTANINWISPGYHRINRNYKNYLPHGDFYISGDGGSNWTGYAYCIYFAMIVKPVADKIYKTDGDQYATDTPSGYYRPTLNGHLDKFIGCVVSATDKDANAKVVSIGSVATIPYAYKYDHSTEELVSGVHYKFWSYINEGDSAGSNPLRGKIWSLTSGEDIAFIMGVKENGTMKGWIRRLYSTKLQAVLASH